MFFRILGEIRNPDTIAAGTSVRQRRRLKRLYGGDRWRKLKGAATVELASGKIREAEIHWYEASGVGKREIKSSGSSIGSTMSSSPRFLICINNEGYAASLDTRKVYQEIPDSDAETQDLVRVIDESGEDYLYPRSMFLPVELSSDVRAAIRRAS